MPEALLLNPPGSRPFARDCYCSYVGRRGYGFQPLDLLLQSGFLAAAGYQVRVLDAIAAGLSPALVLDRARGLAPDLVLVLVGDAAADEDLPFLDRLRATVGPRCRIAVSGDLFQFDPVGSLERVAAADGVLVDFAGPSLGEWGRGAPADPSGIHVRGGPALRRPARTWTQPRPLHELFPRAHYRSPYHPEPFASVLTSFGCPYRCTFCNTSRVPYKWREAEDVVQEVVWLHRFGYRHLYFRDATLAVARKPLLALCDAMAHRDLGMEWHAFTRADLIDAELARVLADSGCRVLQFGVETADPEVLERHQKGLDLEEVRRATEACAAAGIAACGHFIVSWPGEGRARPATDAAADLAVRLGFTFASFNVAEPRPGTPFRGDFGAGDTAAGANRRGRDERGRDERGRAMRRFYGHPRTLGRLAAWFRGPRGWAHAAGLASAALGG